MPIFCLDNLSYWVHASFANERSPTLVVHTVALYMVPTASSVVNQPPDRLCQKPKMAQKQPTVAGWQPWAGAERHFGAGRGIGELLTGATL